MNVYLVYATNSGGTEIVANNIAAVLREAGHTVEVKNVSEATAEAVLAADAAVIGSCTWDYEGAEGQPHEGYRPLMEALRQKKTTGKKFAVFALGDSSYTVFCGAATELEKWVKEIGGNLVTPSLRIDGYYFKQAEHDEAAKAWAQTLTKSLS